MATFTSLPGEVKLAIMEQAQSFRDLANLCDTDPELSALFKRFNRQIIASVSRRYAEIPRSFTPQIFRALCSMDAVWTSLAPGLNGWPVVTYTIGEEKNPCAVDPVDQIRVYHTINVQLAAVMKMIMEFALERPNMVHMPKFQSSVPKIYSFYMTALWKLVHILILAGCMDFSSTDDSAPKFHHPSPDAIEHAAKLTQPMDEAKMNFIIQTVRKLPFNELVAIGDILLIMRHEMLEHSVDGAQPSPLADNDFFKVLCYYQTNGDMNAMLLLAHVWVLIREHKDRDNTIARRQNTTYKMLQDEVYRNLGKSIDHRVFHGRVRPNRGKLPRVEKKYRTDWRDLRSIATENVYTAVGII
ncbi:hypothetical protein PRZ48_009640 [Zasmidium cellare]|uniref:Uncharacterized protein n=1 Tax=Zasmidium cellare TaxID=395010 RepID=A0ABR0ED46_ZASCE|nr:hypothetical protein PRZ48_009640 [Zasmidium cellare]